MKQTLNDIAQLGTGAALAVAMVWAPILFTYWRQGEEINWPGALLAMAAGWALLMLLMALPKFKPKPTANLDPGTGIDECNHYIGIMPDHLNDTDKIINRK